jgi:neutral/alkaline ceramidase-like enzyme
MIRSPLPILLTATLCLVMSLTAATEAGRPVFRAGAAKADITPTNWPLPMLGSFSLRLADKAWDPLHARAIVVADGKTRIAIVVVDSCYCPRTLFDEAKRRIAKSTGIATDHVLGAATHTHTAPASRDRREVKADPQYVERVICGIVGAVEQADANLEPAELGWGVAQVPEEVFNRRWYMKPGGIVANPFGGTNDKVRMNPPGASKLLDRPAGPTDPAVSIVSLRSTDGRPIALLANYSLHYVGGIPRGGVSADYFGEFARLTEERLGGKSGDHPPMVAIMSNGTSADVNNIDFRKPRPKAKPFERMRAVAKRVADAVAEEYVTIEYRSDASLAMSQRLLTLDKRRPTPAQVEQAEKLLAVDDDSVRRLAKAYAHWTMLLNEPPYTEELVLQAVRIGQVGITSIPCEVFTQIGLDIKEKSPLDATFTIELANGHYGYLPTPRQHKLGGYETWLGSCTLEIEASEKIEAVLFELLDQVATTGQP